MIACIQRVKGSYVKVSGKMTGEIKKGAYGTCGV